MCVCSCVYVGGNNEVESCKGRLGQITKNLECHAQDIKFCLAGTRVGEAEIFM